MTNGSKMEDAISMENDLTRLARSNRPPSNVSTWQELMMTDSESPSRGGHSSGSPVKVIRVLVVDDHPAIREALEDVLAGQEDFSLVGETDTVMEALEIVARELPDVVVVDISLREGHGLDLVTEIRQRFEHIQVVVFSMYDEAAYGERAIRAGAVGYVMKTAPIENVLEAIRQAASGQIYLSRRMASRILTRMVKGKFQPDFKFAIDRLTDRELSVFQMLGEGHSIDEIADRLDLSRKTIEAYRRRAKEKLGLESISEVLQHAVMWTSGRAKDLESGT